jgi:hypothetical protein
MRGASLCWQQVRLGISTRRINQYQEGLGESDADKRVMISLLRSSRIEQTRSNLVGPFKGTEITRVNLIQPAWLVRLS